MSTRAEAAVIDSRSAMASCWRSVSILGAALIYFYGPSEESSWSGPRETETHVEPTGDAQDAGALDASATRGSLRAWNARSRWWLCPRRGNREGGTTSTRGKLTVHGLNF